MRAAMVVAPKLWRERAMNHYKLIHSGRCYLCVAPSYTVALMLVLRAIGGGRSPLPVISRLPIETDRLADQILVAR